MKIALLNTRIRVSKKVRLFCPAFFSSVLTLDEKFVTCGVNEILYSNIDRYGT